MFFVLRAAGVFCAIVSHPADSVVSVLNKEKGSTASQVLKRLGPKGNTCLHINSRRRKYQSDVLLRPTSGGHCSLSRSSAYHELSLIIPPQGLYFLKNVQLPQLILLQFLSDGITYLVFSVQFHLWNFQKPSRSMFGTCKHLNDKGLVNGNCGLKLTSNIFVVVI